MAYFRSSCVLNWLVILVVLSVFSEDSMTRYVTGLTAHTTSVLQSNIECGIMTHLCRAHVQSLIHLVHRGLWVDQFPALVSRGNRRHLLLAW